MRWFQFQRRQRIQWLAGAFYAKTNRDYAQRLPTPGYDALLDPVFEAAFGIQRRQSCSAMGSRTETHRTSPRLTYDLRQVAVFGEATYTFFDRLGVTAGLRWYDWEEDKPQSGGSLSNDTAQNQKKTVSSDGFAPRFMIDYDVTDQVAVNAQASRGFRLGGVNDPLNQPLCKGDYKPTEGSSGLRTRRCGTTRSASNPRSKG